MFGDLYVMRASNNRNAKATMRASAAAASHPNTTHN